MMGRMPVGGIVWETLHYVEGFRRLGHDVYYVEDTGAWPFDPVLNTLSADCRYAVDILGQVFGRIGLPRCWAYRCASSGATHGPAGERLTELFADADVLVNVSGATVLKDEHLGVPVRIYVETDPGLAQIEVEQGNESSIDLLDAHTHHATFGERIGERECPLPVHYDYIPTRQPVVLDWWRGDESPTTESLTTVTSWKLRGKNIKWNGELYFWSKHVEWERFLELPRRTTQQLEIAVSAKSTETVDLLRSHGWRVRDALALSLDIDAFRDYVLGSRGEFTVAKDQYVRLRTGWFSERSACYLAGGRPVVTQETGFSHVLPTGQGLQAFTTMDEAVAGIEAVVGDYERNARAAREIAHEYFSAERVLSQLLDRVFA
jgi:hypothetical protein